MKDDEIILYCAASEEENRYLELAGDESSGSMSIRYGAYMADEPMISLFFAPEEAAALGIAMVAFIADFPAGEKTGITVEPTEEDLDFAAENKLSEFLERKYGLRPTNGANPQPYRDSGSDRW